MANRHRCKIWVLGLSFLLWGTSWAFGQTGLPPSNKFCPVLTDEPVDPDIVVEYEGRRVYLCCQKCKKLFEQNPKNYLHNLPAGDASLSAQPSAQAAPAVLNKKPLESPLIELLGHLHPLVVHFPIALIMAAVLADILRLWTREESWSKTGQFCIVLGAAGALVAAALGWLAAASGEYQGAYLIALSRHRWGGIAVAVFSLLAAVWSLGNNEVIRRRIYSILLVISVVLVMGTGFYGGQLGHGIGHFKVEFFQHAGGDQQ